MARNKWTRAIRLTAVCHFIESAPFDGTHRRPPKSQDRSGHVRLHYYFSLRMRGEIKRGENAAKEKRLGIQWSGAWLSPAGWLTKSPIALLIRLFIVVKKPRDPHESRAAAPRHSWVRAETLISLRLVALLGLRSLCFDTLRKVRRFINISSPDDINPLSKWIASDHAKWDEFCVRLRCSFSLQYLLKYGVIFYKIPGEERLTFLYNFSHVIKTYCNYIFKKRKR